MFRLTRNRSALPRSERQELLTLIRDSFATAIFGGLLFGVLWAALTPAGMAIPQQDFYYALVEKELMVTQDAYFAILALLFGFGHSFVVIRRVGQVPIVRMLWVCLTGILGSVTAWAMGGLIGPLRTATPTPEHPSAVLAPLEVHAYGVLFLWPFVAMMCIAFVFLVNNAQYLKKHSNR